MRSICLTTGLVVLLISLTTYLAVAQQDTAITIVVEGESPVYNTNRVEAKARALQDAFVTAVNKVLGTFVTAESYTQNFVSIDRSILTKSRGYIKTYTILGESPGPDMLTLKVEVEVSKEALEHDVDALGILLQAMGHPRVLVAATGPAGGRAAGSAAAAARKMRQILVNKGFRVVEALESSSLPSQAESTRTAVGQLALIRELGRQRGADILIVATGVPESLTTSGLAGLVGCIVRLEATALWAETGKEIATRRISMNGIGPSEQAAFTNAFEKAGGQAALELIADMSRQWNTALLNGRELTLEVTVDDYARLQQFRKRLAKMFGVKSARQKRFSGNRASLEVTFTGSPQALADLLSTTTFPDLQVRITGFTSDQLEVEVR